MVGDNEMNDDLEQNTKIPSRRGRRIAASVVGALGVFTLIVGVLGLLVLSFVGSSALASSTMRSALASGDVRRAVAEELVDKLQEGGDNGVKIIIFVARSKVVDAVAVSLSESKLRNVAGDAAETVYGILVDGKPSTSVDIQMFADAALTAIRTADPFIPQGLSPQVNPIEISRDAGSPDYSRIRAWSLIATAALLVVGIALSSLSWFVSVATRWIRLRRFGIRLAVGGVGLVALAYLARSASFGDDGSGRITEALVSFMTDRLLRWSFMLVALGAVAAVIGVIGLKSRAKSLGVAVDT